MPDSRQRRIDDLKNALDEATASKAIDQAAEFTIRMRGDTTAVPTGALDELMQLAIDQGSVTPAEIADVLDTPQISVEYESNYAVENAD